MCFQCERMGYFYFTSSPDIVTYYPKGGSDVVKMDVGNGTSIVGNDYIQYIPGALAPYNKGSAMWLFNITAQPSKACVLAHYGDDYPRTELIVATDSGNRYTEYWGKTVRTFILQKIGTATGVMSTGGYWAEFSITCFDAENDSIADADNAHGI